jgi:hypothetical protein
MATWTIYDKIREYDLRQKELDHKIAELNKEVEELAEGLKHFTDHDLRDHEIAEQLLNKYHLN